MSARDESYADRLLIIADLFETGLVFKRLQIRRKFPEASSEEVERRLLEWLSCSGGAENGDAEGKVIPWPRP